MVSVTEYNKGLYLPPLVAWGGIHHPGYRIFLAPDQAWEGVARWAWPWRVWPVVGVVMEGVVMGGCS